MKPYYADGTCTIYHCDCREVLPSLGPVDLVFTSPPYNLGVSTGGSFPAQGKSYGKWQGSALAAGYGGFRDALPWSEYEELHRGVLDACWTLLTDRGAIFYNHKPRVQAGVLMLPTRLATERMVLRQIIIWARAGGINAAPTHYCPAHEWIIIWARPGFRLTSQSASMVGDVWRVAQEPGTAHPAPFPVGLPARAIETVAPTSVLDPFMGSGTTLVAAKAAGIPSTGIEVNEAYCEAAAKRLSQGALDFGAAS